ncbi:antibiotic biosynthesis monooxygenase [Luteimonas sp. R10]|uniref:antibiotic biosynthesis monooxygenase n=1 Tax=Luteimonas sp. R10 TaxID=3108176 RepID=UPI003087BCE5|nr:antibiotic biosynthesis monooxygenase [Luteimonas sp. R10]
MIVTVSNVTDFDQFLRTFSNEGAAKRKEHGCKGAHVVRDPDDAHRVWVFFDWAQEDYEGFLADPEVPAIARKLALREPPVKVEPVAQFDA